MSKDAALRSASAARIDDFPVALAFSPDGRTLVVGGGEGRIYRIAVESGRVQMLDDQSPSVLELAWQPKGSLLAVTGQDGALRGFDLETSAPSRILHRSPRWPAGLAWRGDGQQLAVACGKDVLLFDKEGQLLRTIGAHPVPLSHLCWRGRDELIAVGNGALFVERADTGAMEQFVVEGIAQTLSLSSDGRIAVCGLADGTINFRYLNNRKRSRMSGYEGKVHLTAWSANSRYLASASSKASSIVVWDFGGKGPEGSAPLQLEAHEERVEALAWQGAGAMLATAGKDWRLVLWRPGPGSRKPLDIQLLDGPPSLMSWSPDGRWLAVAQTSGNVRLYTLSAA